MSASKLEVRGFNAGYTLEKYVPKLGTALRKSLSNSQNDYAVAFVAGGEEMRKERSRSKLLSKMKNTARSMPKSKERGKDIDR
jgi:hypothetical protein